MILDKLGKLGPREKLGLFVAAVFVLGYLVDRTVVRILVRQMRDLDAAIKVEQQTLDYRLRAVQAEPSVAREYEAVKDMVGRANSQTEANGEIEKLIDDLANRTGLAIRAMEHREPHKIGYCEEYAVDIGNFEGSMASLLSFLDGLQNAPGLLVVPRLSVSAGKAPGQVRGSMMITKVMLVAGQDSTVSAAPAAVAPAPASASGT